MKYVIRGALSATPYYAGQTKAGKATIIHWSSDKEHARHYTSWLTAFMVAHQLKYYGITSKATIERVV